MYCNLRVFSAAAITQLELTDVHVIIVCTVTGSTDIPERAVASVKHGYSAVYYYDSEGRYQIGENNRSLDAHAYMCY